MKYMRYIIRLLQVLLAVTFLLSGLAKCIDPIGTAIKFNDYFLYFGLGFMSSDLNVLLACLVSVVEFYCGFALLFGHVRILALMLITLMMLVFTPLTLWLALTDAIEDCGCFGDAIHLTNWETFGKNVVIDLVLVLLWIKRRHLYQITGKTTFTVHAYIAIAGILVIGAFGMFAEPLVDFRPFRPGVNLLAASQTHESQQTSSYTCIYERNGIQQEFDLNELPDEEEGWTFVETIEHINDTANDKASDVEEIDFFVKNQMGEVVTQDLLRYNGYTFLLLSHSLDAASQHDIDRIEQLYEYANDNGYAFYCVTANDPKQYSNWLYNTGAEYPFLFTDATIVQTICRSNPGVMLLRNGVICWKKDLSWLDVNKLTSAKLNEQSNDELQEIGPLQRFFLLLILLFAPIPLFLLFEIPQKLHKSTKKDSKDA